MRHASSLKSRCGDFALACEAGRRTLRAMPHAIRLTYLPLCFAAMLITLPVVHAQDKPALVMENTGLKNTYRVVFTEFDEQNHFASGALEILSDDDGRDVPHTRIPFSAEVKADPKDKKSEVLEIRCTAGYFFFPPAERREPYPALTWKLTGRKTSKPVLRAKLWSFESEKETWMVGEMEFEKAQE
jgi:hypothetical protein